jgi:hypothetical protein
MDLQSQIELYGFAKVDNLYGQDEISRLITEVTAMRDWADVPGKYWRYYEESKGPKVLNRMERFYEYSQTMQEIIDHPGLDATLTEIMGDRPQLFKEKINFKSSGGSGFNYHQDQAAGWSRYAPIFWSVAIAVDPCTAANGQLEIAKHIPSTRESLGEWAPLDEATLKDLRFESVSMEPGDIVIFDSYVPHGSAPNLSETSRNMVYLTYNQRKYGSLRDEYYQHKSETYPQDCERLAGHVYEYKV